MSEINGNGLMRSGETLIKLAKHKVDSVQKLLAAAQKIHADLIKKQEDLKNNLDRERVIAENNPAMASDFAQYKISMDGQQANLLASLTGVEEEIRTLGEELRIAFEEQKKFETLEERRQAHAAEQKKAREQKAMDEFAIIRSKRA
ncbi:flagellar export protein FliJ [Pseudaquidulcibacter saccharophilus]|uniref:flagellar export protein FliJ n=1 Tax=Pseudaquidulcibacter saccharophilus TaxID=2831900 RepID=UPI001EFF3890|nr:flagellar FliJ family protein [Pseudaquidulcibacter saccharophilus]